MPYDYQTGYSGGQRGGGVPSYTSSGGVGDPSGYKRNMSYSYESGSMPHTGGSSRASLMAPHRGVLGGNPRVENLSRELGHAYSPNPVMGQAALFTGMSQTVPTSAQIGAAVNAEADLQAQKEMLALKQQMEEDDWKRQVYVENLRNNNAMVRDRYGDYRRYGR